jgi:heme exporter protein C
MINFFKFSNIFLFSYYFLPLISLFCFIFLTIGLFLGLVTIPIDFQQGLNYKIIFIHVPSAWFCILIYLIMVFFAILYLIFKLQIFYYISEILCKLGLIFTVITLITGSFWGKPLWGTYWVWDARLTSVFVLFLIYLGIYLLNKLYTYNEQGMKFLSLFILFGFLNIPIIKYSVDWWSTLHQTSSISLSQTSSLHSSVYISLLFIFLSFILLGLMFILFELKIKFINIKFNNI